MPYNPGVQDISGQLLAQGMMNRTQGITSAIKDFAKNEEDRQKTVAAVQGMLMDPYLQQQLSTNPAMMATAEKVKSGNARLSDVQAFLGTLTTLQHGRDEDLKRQQMETQKQYTDALREQAIAQAAANEAANQTRQRLETEAKVNAGFIKDVMRNRPADASAMQAFQDYLGRGGTPTEDAVRMFSGLMSAESQMGATAQRAAAAEGRAAAIQSAADLQAAKAERDAAIKEAKLYDTNINTFKRMLDEGAISQEDYNSYVRDYLKTLSLRGMQTNPLAALMGGMAAGAPVATAAPAAAPTPSAPGTLPLSGANNAASPVRVTNKSEYDRLPPGTWYVDPSGNVGYKAPKP